MVDHNGVLTMQRLLLAGTLGLSMAQKAAAILEGEPDSGAPPRVPPLLPPAAGPDGQGSQEARLPEGAVLRAIRRGRRIARITPGLGARFAGNQPGYHQNEVYGVSSGPRGGSS